MKQLESVCRDAECLAGLHAVRCSSARLSLAMCSCPVNMLTSAVPPDSRADTVMAPKETTKLHIYESSWVMIKISLHQHDCVFLKFWVTLF